MLLTPVHYKLLLFTPSGFSKGLSADCNLARLQRHVVTNMNNNKATAMISLDCSKAFDSVDHNILLQRMKEYNFPAQLLDITTSYLAGRTFSVRIGNTLTTRRNSYTGFSSAILVP
ncbi:reverse transcriptase domain-containing protein, partial [Klebsiella pneumoniae]|uniref:reverse transcriptase domain-containing protein n=1 Tax=Klebsiella pneumoniae TaxID=573 RepID=UPI0040558E27